MSKSADLDTDKPDADEDEPSGEREAKSKAEDVPEDVREAEKAAADAEAAEVGAPQQLGHKRFVYAGYMGGAIAIAFLLSKVGNLVWYRVSQWKPQWGLGDPKDELIMGIGAAIGAIVALYYWRKKKARQYIEEVAEELSKVTWPSRKEVTNSTAVVVFTTLSMTVFFALMDQFWRYVTDKIYSF